MKFDQEGLINVFEKLLSSTRELYIKGYIEMKKEFGAIPDKKEYGEFRSKMRNKFLNPQELSKMKKMDGYWEAKAFFTDDPYGILSADSDSVCKSLDILAEGRIKEIEKKRKNKERKN